jgi:hypothetical protein
MTTTPKAPQQPTPQASEYEQARAQLRAAQAVIDREQAARQARAAAARRAQADRQRAWAQHVVDSFDLDKLNAARAVAQAWQAFEADPTVAVYEAWLQARDRGWLVYQRAHLALSIVGDREQIDRFQRSYLTAGGPFPGGELVDSYDRALQRVLIARSKAHRARLRAELNNEQHRAEP